MARNVAFSIANSPLVKTAIAGEDPNWGRIIMACGKSGENIIANKIQLKIEEAKVILDIDLFGNNVVLTELDIAHYFSKAFNLNGPNPMSEHIEFNLPNGEIRQIKVATNQSYMLLEKDAIVVKTALDFKQ